LTEEDIVRRGAIAASLLDNPDLLWFFDHLKLLTLEAISQSRPEQQADRERLYNQYRSVDDVLGVMHSYVDAAKAIHERNESTID
jgi:hypothetical protein